MAFEGADVDGLDAVARDCAQAAQVVDDVKAVCEAIVAAASIFGPFGAAFIAYLRSVVIPWLTKIAEALQLFGKVLSMRSLLQRDASSASTSLPTYTTPGDLPSADTNNYPVMATTTGSALWGLVHYTSDGNGLSDITLGGDDGWGAATAHLHIGRDASGNVTAVTETDDVRLGAANDPLVAARAGDGGYSLTLGTPHLTNDAGGAVATSYDAQGRVTGVSGSGHENLTLNGIPLLRSNATFAGQVVYGSDGTVAGYRADGGADLALGPGAQEGLKQTALPAGVESVPELPNGETATPTFKAAEANAQVSFWGGSFGDGHAFSANAHSPELTGGLGFGANDGPAGGATGTLGAAASISSFQGTLIQNGHTTSGVAGGVDVSAGYSGQVGGSYNADGGRLGGYYTAGAGAKGGLGASGYALDRDGTLWVGGSGELFEVDVKGGLHAALPGTAADNPETSAPRGATRD